MALPTQVAFLLLFHRAGSAWVNATFLVLGESNVIIAILFEAFLVDKTQVDVFDSVMLARGHEDLIKTLRPVNEQEPDPVKALGVPLFLLLTGYRAGPLLQWRYFKLKEMSKRERKAFIKAKTRRWQYLWFGTVYLVLQLIPILSMLFLLTSAAGSALWAADMEEADKHNARRPEEDEPPAYTDEP
ncbi:hypothetical protein H2203_003368 [Taxawa tesnikishii (nom. ined.)]|nr:hypothetical protein H2203_003368 [Dothideales sp. JES 119]